MAVAVGESGGNVIRCTDHRRTCRDFQELPEESLVLAFVLYSLTPSILQASMTVARKLILSKA